MTGSIFWNEFLRKLTVLRPGAGVAGMFSIMRGLGRSFALRTTIASLTALYIAFSLHLDSPMWAGTTVWIVAQSNRGMSLSKSRYRILGTATGAVVSIVLLAAFPQQPGLFFLSLALWLGLCSAVATAQRNFRSYAAVLAGYTVAIVAFDAIADPTHVFDIAISRASYVVIGTVVEAVFTAILAPGSPELDVRQLLESYLDDAAKLSVGFLTADQAAYPTLHRFFSSAIHLETSANYAAAASMVVRSRLGYVHASAVRSLVQLAMAQSLHRLTRCDINDDVRGLATRAVPLLKAETPSRSLRELADDVQVQFAREITNGASLETLAALDRLRRLLIERDEALAGQSAFVHAVRSSSTVRYRFPVDWVGACVNGIRAATAVLLSAVIWITTAWPGGAGFVSTVCIVCSLFATHRRPVIASVGLVKGTFCACIVAMLCNFVLIPRVSDFPLLALILAPFLFAAGKAMQYPRTAPLGVSFNIFVWGLIDPRNAMRTNEIAFFNGSMSLLLGMICGGFVFALLFPIRPLIVRRRLTEAAKRDLAQIGRTPGSYSISIWYTRMADRLTSQLETSADVPAEAAATEFDAMMAMLTLGETAIRLNDILERTPATSRPIKAVLACMVRSKFSRLSAMSALAARRLFQQGGTIPLPEAQDFYQGAVLLHVMADAAAVQRTAMCPSSLSATV